MSDPILEENVERLLRRCVPRVPAEQVERSLARAMRRGEKPARHRSLPVAVAAAAVLAIAGWLVVTSRPGTNGPARQDPPKPETAREIDRLIGELGGPARPAAEARLREIGRPTLEALDKALYHENPDVRIPARDLARLIRKELSERAALEKARVESAPVREAVRKVRERWKARDFADLQEAVRDAFRPAKLGLVHYVPKKLIDAKFRLGKPGEESGDSLSREIAEALNREDGVVFLGQADHALMAYGSRVVFTLPDKKGWSAYVVAEIVGAPVVDRTGKPYASENYKSRLLASTESRQVWGMDPDEIDWADQNFDRIIDSDIQISPDAGGGLRIDAVTAGSIVRARGYMTGDVVKDINGQPVNSLADVRKIFGGPAMKEQSGVRINLERSGKTLVLEYRPLPR